MRDIYQEKKPTEKKSYLYLENPSNNTLLSASGCHQISHFIEFLYLFKIIIYKRYITQVIHNLQISEISSEYVKDKM